MDPSSAEGRGSIEPWDWRDRLSPHLDSDDNSPQKGQLSLIYLTPPSSGRSKSYVPTGKSSETPIRRGVDIAALPKQLSFQCGINDMKTPKVVGMPSILEEGEDTISRKRSLSLLSHSTPKKKLCCQIETAKKLSRVLCVHQKDNSPIKVDCGGVSGFYHPFILKPPPRKLEAPCPAHNFQYKDFLSDLGSRNMGFVIKQIFSHLSPQDLSNVALVSTRWHKLTTDYSPVRSVAAVLNKENVRFLIKKQPPCAIEAKSRNEKTPLKLFIVSNKNPSPKRKVVSLDFSPRTKRFNYFLEESKTLGKGERLTKCPKCGGPARVSPKNCNVTCSSCRHDFCHQCRSFPHPDRSCSLSFPSSPSPQKKGYTIGSKASKRALKRLL